MNNILILGAKGMVGGQLHKLLPGATAWDRTELDVTDSAAAHKALTELKPTVVINCVAFNDVDGAETNRDTAFRLNTEVVRTLAGVCNEIDATLVHFSTGYVFDGNQNNYNEDSAPNPISVYAESKLAGEQIVQTIAKKYYLVRTNAVFGPAGESEASKTSFVDLMLNLEKKMPELKAVVDETNSITYAPDLAAAVINLIEANQPYGIYHITNEGFANWYDFAKQIFTITGSTVTLTPVPGTEFPRAAKRAGRIVINNTKLPKLRPWQEALKEYLTNI